MRPPIKLFIAGLPKGQPRPKACRRGNHAGVYDPGTANEWKAIVRLEVSQAWDKSQFVGPVRLRLQFIMPRPKAHYLRGVVRDTAPAYHVSRPDADNLAKAVMDALSNLGIWKDDSQVAVLHVEKVYGSGAGCVLSLSEALDGETAFHHID